MAGKVGMHADSIDHGDRIRAAKITKIQLCHDKAGDDAVAGQGLEIVGPLIVIFIVAVIVIIIWPKTGTVRGIDGHGDDMARRLDEAAGSEKLCHHMIGPGDGAVKIIGCKAANRVFRTCGFCVHGHPPNSTGIWQYEDRAFCLAPAARSGRAGGSGVAELQLASRLTLNLAEFLAFSMPLTHTAY